MNSNYFEAIKIVCASEEGQRESRITIMGPHRKPNPTRVARKQKKAKQQKSESAPNEQKNSKMSEETTKNSQDMMLVVPYGSQVKTEAIRFLSLR